MELNGKLPESTPLWQQVANLLRESISAGDLKPRDRVVEAELARQLGTSRGPVREAIRKLEQQGLVEYRPNHGVVVTEVAEPGLTDLIGICEIREFLERKAIRLVIDSRDTARLAPIEAVYADMQRVTGPDMHRALREYVALDMRLHERLIVASGSKVLHRTWMCLDPYTLMTAGIGAAVNSPTAAFDLRQTQTDHRQLMEAMRAWDLPAAENALREHFSAALSGVRAASGATI